MTSITKVPANEFAPVTTSSAATMALNALAPFAEQFSAPKATLSRRQSIRDLVADYDERGRQIG
jgi:hypothetical protein